MPRLRWGKNMKRFTWLSIVACLGCGSVPSAGPSAVSSGGPPDGPTTPAAPTPATTAATKAAADPEPAGPILLAVRGTTMNAERKARRALEIDDRLSSGDFFAYHVRVDRDAYVYVLQFYADGTAQVLFPQRGAERVFAGRETRLPLDGRAWFQLDEAVGTEHLYVIASTEPLETSEPKLAALIGNVRTSPTALSDGASAAVADDGTASVPEPPTHTPPPSTTQPAHQRVARRAPAPRSSKATGLPRLRERAAVLVRVEDDGVVEYRGRAPDEGVGVVHFPFEHR